MGERYVRVDVEVGAVVDKERSTDDIVIVNTALLSWEIHFTLVAILGMAVDFK